MQTRIGKYELKKLLGIGASGKVYLAFDTYSEKDVALKLLDAEFLHDANMGEFTHGQFMTEASLAGKLSHPHIVSILEAVTEENTGYIAMEYVPGGDLKRFTKSENLLPVEDVIQIGFKSCSALDYAFRQGIVHRDIKPANVLIVEGTNIKIADFGAALLKTAQTTQDLRIGTPHYMSPEQISGSELTLQNDMYAMGVMLYELLTGQRPLTGSTLQELFERVIKEDPRPPSALRTSVPANLDPVILRALGKRPEDRYPTWADFALDLAQVGKLSIYQRDIPDSEKFSFFRKSVRLEKLDDAQIWELVHASQWKRLSPGNAILREDEAGQSMFMLAQGQVKVTKKGRLLDVLQAGECFGEMAYIQGESALRHATVQSMTDVLIAEFKVHALERISEACQLQFTRALVRILVERLALADTRLVQQHESPPVS